MNIPSDIQTASLLVSVGMPVYNGGKSLTRALDSLLAQTHKHLEIIISDNASTDDTAEICSRYAEKDHRIVYHRQPANLGAGVNFETVLRRAQGEFFMWAAHDDFWHQEFVEANLVNLLGDQALIASVSQVEFVDGDRSVRLRPWVSHGTFSLAGSLQSNIRRYVFDPGMNSRFYALFRREVLLKCLPFSAYCAGDWTFVVKTLAFGNYAEVKRVLFYRNLGGESSNPLRTLRRGGSGVGYWLPLWQFTRDVLRMPHVRPGPGLLLRLTIINVVYVVLLIKASLFSFFDGRK